MPTTQTIVSLELFAAAPSELSEEKTVIANVVAELNRSWRKYHGIEVRYRSWETDSHPDVGQDAQDVINRQIGETYDIFIGLMWSRFGTSTSRFGSGTEEEFERAYARSRKSSGAVTLMFYFKDEPLAPSQINAEQLAAVSKFRNSIECRGVFHRSFSNREQFEQLLRLNLPQVVEEWIKRLGASERTTRSVALTPAAETPSDVLQQSDDDEFGFLDLIELGGNALTESTEANARIFKSLDELNEKMTVHTEGFESLTSSPIAQRFVLARRIADSFAEDMTLFAKRVEIEAPAFVQKFRTGIEYLTKALLISVTLNPVEINDAKVAIAGCETLLATIIVTEPKIQGLHEKILGLPYMTHTTNRAKKRLATAMLDYVSGLQNARALVVEALNTLNGVLISNGVLDARSHA